jgi:hypothetical protein
VVLVVAAGALALLVSVVGAWALPGAAGVVLLLEEALWSFALEAAVPAAAPAAAPVAAPSAAPELEA